MKKVLSTAAFAVCCLFISCNNSPKSTEVKSSADTTSTMASKEVSQSDKNSENMKSVYKGIENGDLSVMDAFVAEDIVDHDGPRGPIKGRDSVKKFLADLHNHIADMKFDIISETTGGDYHFALTRLTGKTKDGMMGMPANTTISDTTVDVVRLRDGKVVEHWGFERVRHMKNADKSKKGKM
jgi:ketosteroid isomerase-like protein